MTFSAWERPIGAILGADHPGQPVSMKSPPARPLRRISLAQFLAVNIRAVYPESSVASRGLGGGDGTGLKNLPTSNRITATALVSLRTTPCPVTVTASTA